MFIISAEDAVPHDLLLCIQTGKLVTDEDRMRYEGGQFFLNPKEEMQKIFPYAREALENTHKIAERCNVEIVFGQQKVPKFDVPEEVRCLRLSDGTLCCGSEKKIRGKSAGRTGGTVEIRTDHHSGYGLCGLFSHCLGFHPFCQKSGHSRRSRKGIRPREVSFPIVWRLPILILFGIS